MAIFSDRGSTPLTSTRISPIVTVDWWNKKQRIVYNSTILCFCLKMILYTFTAFLLSADRFYKIFRTIPDFALSLELIR